MKGKKLKNQGFFVEQFFLEKNRKGFLLAEETLKIVIAVISIGFLVYFLSSLYFANKTSAELEQAKASLDFLVKEVNAGSAEVILYNPKGWVLTSWNEGKLPNRCSNLGWKECLCMSDKENQAVKFLKNTAGYVGLANDEKKRISNIIDSGGTCLESDIKVQNNLIEVDEVPLTLKIKDRIIKK
jgi:hypothetical protein